MIIIRPAVPSDARSIAHVQVETWRSTYRGIVDDEFLSAFSEDDRTIRWSEIVLNPEQATFVAEVDERNVVGFVNGGPEREGRKDYLGEISGLYVLPSWHGKGIGRRLVATFARWLVDSGFDTMKVWVLAENSSRHFYEHLGGKLVGKQVIKIGGQSLDEVAYGWKDTAALADNATR